jgi:hypothetical protein
MHILAEPEKNEQAHSIKQVLATSSILPKSKSHIPSIPLSRIRKHKPDITVSSTTK